MLAERKFSDTESGYPQTCANIQIGLSVQYQQIPPDPDFTHSQHFKNGIPSHIQFIYYLTRQ